MKVDILVDMVKKSVNSLTNTNAFRQWYKEKVKNDGDLIIFNNSFIFRKPIIKTRKNSQHLCVKVKDGKPDIFEIFVVRPGDIDSDFKLFSAKLGNLPEIVSLQDAIPLDYEDREIIEILAEFTRAPVTVVAENFWKQNAIVMDEFKKLLAETEKALWELNYIRQ